MHGNEVRHRRKAATGTRGSTIASTVVMLCAALVLLGRSGDGRRRIAGDAPAGAPARPPASRLDASRPAGSAASAPGEPAPGARRASSASFDLGAVIEQVHYAYRRKDGAWRGGHTTYEVALMPDGALEVVPYHHPGGRAGAGRLADREREAADAQKLGLFPLPRASGGEGQGERAAPSGSDSQADASIPHAQKLGLFPLPRASGGEGQGEGAAPSGSDSQADAVAEGSAVRFAPSRVERGGAPVASGAGDAGIDARGRLEIDKGSLVERLANGPEGLEQSWGFAEPPGGSGDLEVRIALADGSFLGETEAGLHFGGAKLGVRYGHATWIDALGVETPVPARWNGSAIVLRVPAAVLDGSVYPAVLDPIISPELSMDEPVYGPASNQQTFIDVASDGSGWLVVWQDYRGSGADVYGARVSGAGALLDIAGIPIATTPESEYSPAVAWNGTTYLVAWGGATLRAARVTAAGDVLDTPAFTIAAAAADQADPAIAWSGSQFLVAWRDGRNGTNDIFCARVTGAAEVLDPDGIAVSTAANAQVMPAVAWNGTDWLVVWHDYRDMTTSNTDVYGARIAADGTVRDPSGIAIAKKTGYQYDAGVACDGTSCLVAWYDSDDIYGALVTSAGAVVQPNGFPISTAANIQRDPRVAWDGAGYLVVWTDPRVDAKSHIYGARVSSAGTVLDPEGRIISPTTSSQQRPVVAWNGTSHLVAWEHASTDVHGARVSGSAEVLDPTPIVISTAANAQSAPAVASDGTDYLVVWRDLRNGSYGDIYGARLSGTDGSMLDAAGIAISTATTDQGYPAVAWGGASYLVVWEDALDVVGARVSPAGAVLDPSGIAVAKGANEQRLPAVSWGGASYLVVWEEARGAPTYTDILGARVNAAGEVLDATPFVISATSLAQQSPAVASDGTDHLVVWHESRSQTNSFDIMGARVSGAGAVLDTPAFVVSAAANSEYYPAVAWDGANHLVVWADHRSGPNGVSGSFDIYGARVTAGGAVLDGSGFAISTEVGDQTLPAVAWDGTRHLVVWQDLRGGGFPDVYAAQVTPGGAVLDATGILVSGSPQYESNAAIASRGADRFLVAYMKLDTSPVLGSWRVRARSLDFSLVPVAFAQSVTTSEDTEAAVTLEGVDPEGDPLTFTVVTSPAHGTLSGTGAALTYAPDANYSGSDSFTFEVSDGTDRSSPATVTIAVTPVNDAPVAAAQDVALAEDGSLDIALGATDVDGDSLTYAVGTAPLHGTLSGAGAGLTYTPDADFHGTDAFTFSASDGTIASSEATVSISVSSVNDAPVAQAQSVTVAGNASVAIALAATDVDGDALTCAVATPPAHGTLSGAGADLVYTPAAGYDGPDAFAFTANDGTVDSAAATVTITVIPEISNIPPKTGGCGCGSGGDAAPLGVVLIALLGFRGRRR